MPEKCSAPDKRHQVDVIVLGSRDDKVARYRLLGAAPISPSIRERCDVAVKASGAKAIEAALADCGEQRRRAADRQNPDLRIVRDLDVSKSIHDRGPRVGLAKHLSRIAIEERSSPALHPLIV